MHMYMGQRSDDVVETRLSCDCDIVAIRPRYSSAR